MTHIHFMYCGFAFAGTVFGLMLGAAIREPQVLALCAQESLEVSPARWWRDAVMEADRENLS